MADNLVFVKGKPETAMTLGEVISSAYKAQVPLSAIGSWFPPRVYPKSDNTHDQMHAFTFGACGVEVEVDTETGELTILRCILACDVGKAINPEHRRRADGRRYGAKELAGASWKNILWKKER